MDQTMGRRDSCLVRVFCDVLEAIQIGTRNWDVTVTINSSTPTLLAYGISETWSISWTTLWQQTDQWSKKALGSTSPR